MWYPTVCSNELVDSLRREMKECVSQVTRGRALLDLATVFQVGHSLGAPKGEGRGAVPAVVTQAGCQAMHLLRWVCRTWHCPHARKGTAI